MQFVPKYLHNSKQFFVTITDLEGKLIYVNKYAQSLFIFPEKVIGEDSLKAIHSEDANECLRAVTECFQNPTSVIKTTLRKPTIDGGFRWTDWEFSLYFVEEKPFGIFCLGSDVSDKKLIEKNLEDSEQRWKHAVETSGDGIIEINLETAAVFFSKKFQTDLGFTDSEKMETIEDFISRIDSKDKARFQNLLDASKKGEISFFEEEIHIHNNENILKTFVLKGKSFPIIKNQNPKFQLLTFRDITEKLALELENKKSIDLIRKQLRKINQVSHLNAHELRAPLSNILGIIEIVKDKKKDIEQYFEFLDASAVKMDNVIRHLHEILQSTEMEIDIDLLAKIQKKHPKSIYLVDDDLIQNMVNSKMIEDDNPDHKIRAFTDPLEALESIKENLNHIDLLFLDLNMPEMNGWDFLKELDKFKINFDIQILTSSLDKKDFIRAGFHLHVKGVIHKPLKKDILISLLN